jgi:hypothetical protein
MIRCQVTSGSLQSLYRLVEAEISNLGELKSQMEQMGTLSIHSTSLVIGQIILAIGFSSLQVKLMGASVAADATKEAVKEASWYS